MFFNDNIPFVTYFVSNGSIFKFLLRWLSYFSPLVLVSLSVRSMIYFINTIYIWQLYTASRYEQKNNAETMPYTLVNPEKITNLAEVTYSDRIERN